MKIPRLEIITIVLDGEPWIERHLPEFHKLRCDWHWHVIEGVANNRHCTNWCKPLRPRLSNDGTTEYLAKIAGDPRITIRRNAFWDGKITMVNAPMESIKEPAVVMQIDSDELWAASQLDKLVRMFKDLPRIESMQFYCRYFVGKDIITTALGHYGNNPGEWLRAWRYHKGARFQSHEPPVFNHNIGWCMPPENTASLGLNFEHMAYATEAQVRLKEYLYGYENAVAHWKRLQENTTWPVRLKDFLPWVDDGATADKLKNKTS
jgi:hypothetical protein